jgi:hypothetical protein
VIQEFSENQSYLNALSSLSMSKELRLKVPSASAEQVLHNQKCVHVALRRVASRCVLIAPMQAGDHVQGAR